MIDESYTTTEILNNDSESSKLNVDLFHAVNQVYFAREEQAVFLSNKSFWVEEQNFRSGESPYLLTTNEEVVNGTNSFITSLRADDN